MPSNDEVVFGIPNIQCPSCQQVLDCSGKRIDKFTKDQRRKMNDAPEYLERRIVQALHDRRT